MQRICAWCETDLGLTPDGRNSVTHGICGPCRGKLLEQLGQTMNEFLENFEVPIVVVNQAGVASSANAAARVLLKKDLGQISGLPGGNIFACQYSGQPGDCGKNPHCVACTVRRAVMDTMQTGQGRDHVTAYLNQKSATGHQRFLLRISTEKMGNHVLLRIDDMRPWEAELPA